MIPAASLFRIPVVRVVLVPVGRSTRLGMVAVRAGAGGTGRVLQFCYYDRSFPGSFQMAVNTIVLWSRSNCRMTVLDMEVQPFVT